MSRTRWNSEEGRNRLIALVEETRFELVGELPAGLQINSRLNIKCTECGSNVSPTIDKLKQHKVGCFCTGHLRWDSEDGRKRLSDIIDTSRFALVGEFPTELSINSKLILKCTDCGITASPTIEKLKIDNVGCICNGSLKWDSEDGRKRLVDMIDESRFELVGDIPPGLDSHTKINLKCTECGVTVSPTVQYLKAEKTGCLCNVQLKWDSEEGRKRLVDLIEESRFELVGELPSGMTINSKLNLKCTECGVTASPTIDALKIDNVGCLCNGQLKWDSEDGRKRLVDIIDKSRFELVGELPAVMRNNSRISLKCTDCGVNVSPPVKEVKNNNVGCLCNNSTEKMVHDFTVAVIEQLFTGRKLRVDTQYSDYALRGVNRGVLRFDMVIVDDDVGNHQILFIEADGGHHFGVGHALLDTERDNHIPDHDLTKEEYVLDHQASMARLEVKTVRRNKLDWASWLQGIIEAAIDYRLEPAIYRLSSGSQYITGDYAERRRGTRVDPFLTIRRPIAVGPIVAIPKATVVQVPIVQGEAAASSTLPPPPVAGSKRLLEDDPLYASEEDETIGYLYASEED